MSDYVDNDMQLAPCENLDGIDWSAEYQSIMQEPWMDFVDWSSYETPDQGAAALHGDGTSFLEKTPWIRHEASRPLSVASKDALPNLSNAMLNLDATISSTMRHLQDSLVQH
ncbi:hypothetical protein N0V90_003186 [Kalmusia sp. IMI 367209]|nr:hypothetical protein N0V90_003186 [Kalmusia sp. IMI 367209]